MFNRKYGDDLVTDKINSMKQLDRIELQNLKIQQDIRIKTLSDKLHIMSCVSFICLFFYCVWFGLGMWTNNISYGVAIISTAPLCALLIYCFLLTIFTIIKQQKQDSEQLEQFIKERTK